jgi:hypothetical protein
MKPAQQMVCVPGAPNEIASNNNWNSDDKTNIENRDPVDHESTILVTLDPGSYTTVIRGKNKATGGRIGRSL